ncbi:GntR family transcriptional regulator [uncultured Enterovirga sp.]|uniref:GntR family transcriptional regulator n=1 Tax=uncultured Enterovirga sp. TaxID=2026352 RepID=UPI0035CC2684
MLLLDSNPTLMDRVYGALRDAIADCTFAPGTRIRQLELADQLGVSRQPVSHALHLLKQQGLVEEHGRKGFRVAPIDPARIGHLYESRGALDGLAARLAASRIGADAAGRAALVRALEAGRAADPAATPVPGMIRLDVEFHRALYRLSGNPAFEEMVGPYWPHLSRAMAAMLDTTDRRAGLWAEHAVIAERVLAGDGESAECAARDHVRAASRRAEAKFESLAAA